jgi:pimeloyl-ACP methyl ester carboxylesterase
MTRPVDVISSDGVRLSASVTGPEAAATIMLVHGYPDDRQVWDRLVPLLSREFRVVTYDVRGCGASEPAAGLEGYRLAQLADDLFAVIAATSPDQPIHLVGHDWGAIQCWEAVTDARARQHIATFTSISGPCLDHVGRWLRGQARPGQMGKLARQAIKSWYIGAFHFPLLAPTLWRAGLGNRWHDVLARVDDIADAPASDRTLDGVRGIALYRRNILPRLLNPRARHCSLPVQLVIAERDRFVGPEMALSAQPWAEDLTVTRIDAGHWLPLSHPQPLAQGIIRHILRQKPGARAA